MGLKRIIAPNHVNKINGCYFDEISNLGHTPIYLMCRYERFVNHDSSKVIVKIEPKFKNVLTTHGDPFIHKKSYVKEVSPRVSVHYKTPELWDDTINKICAVWGKEAVVHELLTKNRENGHVVFWSRHATENGRRGSQLVLTTINDVGWKDCHYKRQQSAAGEFWVDTCEYIVRTGEYSMPTCQVGAHS
jgi:hypothetical protein